MKLEPKHYYMALPVLLLGMSFTIQFTAAALASRGNAAEVERDYYDRAVNWDAYQKEVAHSQALGWQLSIEPQALDRTRAEHTVDFVITTNDGYPVTGLTGTVHAFQTAHVNAMSELAPREVEPGRYRATHAPKRYGNWVWRYRLQREVAGNVELFVGEAPQSIYLEPNAQ